MNKKGITLVELLAVLVVISIISLIAFPIINGIINDSRKGVNDLNISSIEEAAAAYLADNIGEEIGEENFKSENDGVNIRLKELFDSGYLSDDLKDSINDKKYDLDASYVQITKDENKNYNYNVQLNTK